MSIVIQDSKSGKFATPDGGWTRNLAKAISFDQALRAWEEIGERGLSGVRILLKEKDSAMELARA
jgi:hypothetical protein